MVGNDLVSNIGYVICGAASESLSIVLTITSIITLMVLVAVIVFGTNDDAPEEDFLRRKPLLVPSFVFVITLVLVIGLAPHPMAQYYGPNEVQRYFNESADANFRVHDDGIAYQNRILIYVSEFLEPDEADIIEVAFYQNDTLVTSVSMVINGTPLSNHASGELIVELEPGWYQVRINAVRTVTWKTLTISQRLTSGFFDEVLDWETYTFILSVISFFFILSGLCIAREDKKRFSYERIDQEPPKDGADYARRA
ncbi:MAG: hypothetical protein ACTSU3_08850 [Candidatus Thorarchaeota archaeon]